MAELYRGIDTSPLARPFLTRSIGGVRVSAPMPTPPSPGSPAKYTPPECRFLTEALTEVRAANAANPPQPNGEYATTVRRRTQRLATRRILGIDPWLGEPTGQRAVAELATRGYETVWESPCTGREGHFEGVLIHLPYTAESIIWDQVECNPSEIKSTPSPESSKHSHTLTVYCGTCGVALNVDFNQRLVVFVPWPINTKSQDAATLVEVSDPATDGSRTVSFVRDLHS